RRGWVWVGAPKFLPEVKMEGKLGGSIIIECPLPEMHVRIYLCRTIDKSGRCTTVVSSSKFVREEFKHRVSLEQYPDRNLFLVEMTGHPGKKSRCLSLQHGLIDFYKCTCLLGSRCLHRPVL
uniref:Uncharacterized protein n=1 Tax=Moschus moschiferus TaxID=68415 RepID=A0A8C6D0E2_MOSMO